MKSQTKQISLVVAVAHHGNGVYRPGNSGGDSENTPDTKPVAWAVTGCRGQNLRHVRDIVTVILKGGFNLVEKMFMRVNEVAEALDVSEPYAYKLIRKLNEELKQKGCIVIAGRIDRRFFYEKFYGSNTNK
jgi:hypothetical protein